MRNKFLLIALILLFLNSCKKDDPEPTPINYFVNKSWESINPYGLSISIDFISETECKWTSKIPMFSAVVTFENYTFNKYKANLIDKNTGKIDWVCVLNGSKFTLEGRSEVFTRTK